MPTLIRPVIRRMPVVTYENLPGVDDSFADVLLSQEIVELPSVQRRPKPRDLLASSTFRQVTSLTQECIAPRIERVPVATGFQSLYNYDQLPQSFEGLSANFDPLMAKILTKIKDQKVNISVMIPELGKTTDLFFNLARTVYEGYKRLRRGQFIQGAIWDRRRTSNQQTKWLAKRWLEFSYGVKPTMSDIYGLYQELQRVHHSDFQHVRTKGTISATFERDLPGFREVTQQSTVDMRMRARFRSEALLRSSSAFGITNPLATAWELVPYSFVLDWAIGVGDYLNNIDALIGVTDVIVLSSSKTTHLVEGMSRSSTLADGGGDGYCRVKYVDKTRNSASSPYFPPPQLDGAFSKGRAANALALLRSLKWPK